MQTVAHVSLLNMMLSSNYDSSHGASSVVSQAEEVPGSLPRRSPPQATKLYGPLPELEKTVAFIAQAGIGI